MKKHKLIILALFFLATQIASYWLLNNFFKREIQSTKQNLTRNFTLAVEYALQYYKLLYKNTDNKNNLFPFKVIKKQLKNIRKQNIEIIIKKSIPETKDFNNQNYKYPNFTLLNTYIFENKSPTSQNIKKIINSLGNNLKNQIIQKIKSNKNFSIYLKNNINYNILYFVFLKISEANPAAYIISYSKEKSIEEYRSEYNTFLIISRILILLMNLLIWYILKKDEQLIQIDSDYKDILDANTDIIFMVNMFGKQLYFNKQMETLYGYKMKEMIGKNFKKFVPKSELPKFLTKLNEVLLNKQIAPFETFAQHKNGTVIPVEINGKVIRYKGKHVVVGTAKDITIRKQKEQELRKLFTATEQNPASIVITDTKGNIEYTNPRFTNLTGYSLSEALGKNPRFLKSGHTTKKEYEHLWKTISSGNIWKGEFKNIKKNSDEFWERATIAPIKNTKGKIINYISIKEDITQTREIQLALESSEKKYRAIFNNANDGILLADIESKKIINANNTICNMLGYKENELLKMTIIDIHPEKNLPKLIKIFNKQIKNKLNLAENFPVQHKNGKIFYVDINTSLIELDNKTFILGIFRDITKRKEYEQTLKENETHYKTIFNNPMIGISIINKKGTILDTNLASEKLHGYSRKETIGVSFNRHIHPEDKDRAHLALERLISKKEKNISIELRIIHKTSKKIRWMGIIATLYPDLTKKGESLVIVFFQDISDKIKSMRDLKEAMLEADRANRLKSEFLANMSHEIRTPLNAVIGFSRILQMRLQDKKNKSFADRITKGGENLLELINDILDLSKIEAGQLEIQKEASNPHKLFEELPVIFSELSAQKHIPIELELDQNLPKSLLMDSFRIKQILMNLLSNALKFTNKGKITISVSCEGNVTTGNKIALKIKIKDTGIGIPENQTEHIFDSFRQVEGQKTRKHGGTGLGLAITKHLTELMQGSISVKSTPGEGSVFYLYLPEIEVLEHKPKKPKENNNPDLNFEQSKLLIVEDIDFNREIIKGLLKKTQIEIIEAENGKEALLKLESTFPDLILMDIQMPELDGFETTKIIRKNPKLKDIPIIALSANATQKEILQYKYVFNEYLTKPVNLEILLDVLKKYLPYKSGDNTDDINYEDQNYLKELKEYGNKSVFSGTAFQEIYLNEILPLYEDVKDILDVNDCIKLAGKIEKLGKDFNIKVLENFASDLKNVSENFQLAKIKTLLKTFSEMITLINKADISKR